MKKANSSRMRILRPPAAALLSAAVVVLTAQGEIRKDFDLEDWFCRTGKPKQG